MKVLKPAGERANESARKVAESSRLQHYGALQRGNASSCGRFRCGVPKIGKIDACYIATKRHFERIFLKMACL
jgi:hypothetical protein